MVVLDSDHSHAHVAAEIAAYSSLVTPGCYLVVEDTNVNGNPVLPEWGPGPMEAVDEFLDDTQLFARDPAREKFMMTFNPGGYLRRV
jgi:cephalosporin hydroxylase